MPYVATINIPGYLPQDDDPPVFDTAQEAWEYLADERERGEDSAAEEEGPYTETVGILRAVAVALEAHNVSHLSGAGITSDGIGTVYGSTPGYDGTHDLGLAYCVTLAE